MYLISNMAILGTYVEFEGYCLWLSLLFTTSSKPQSSEIIWNQFEKCREDEPLSFGRHNFRRIFETHYLEGFVLANSSVASNIEEQGLTMIPLVVDAPSPRNNTWRPSHKPFIWEFPETCSCWLNQPTRKKICSSNWDHLFQGSG